MPTYQQVSGEIGEGLAIAQEVLRRAQKNLKSLGHDDSSAELAAVISEIRQLNIETQARLNR